MKRNNLALILILVFVICIFLTTNHFFALKSQRTHLFDAHVEVSERTAGFNLTNESLEFSVVPREGKATKKITIPSLNEPRLIIITSKGNLSEWLFSPQNGMQTTPNNSTEVSFIVSIPANATIGEERTSKVSIELQPLK